MTCNRFTSLDSDPHRRPTLHKSESLVPIVFCARAAKFVFQPAEDEKKEMKRGREAISEKSKMYLWIREEPEL